MPQVLSFDEAVEASDGGPLNALLGNGFSIAQAGGQFGYANLLERADLPDKSCVRNVFSVLKTVDFEEVMHALEHAAVIEEAYGDTEKSIEFRRDADIVRDSLIHAVRAVHPGGQFEIPKLQIDSCARFLRTFRSIFTLNYDLLLYWVMLKSSGHTDGFGLGAEINGFRTFQPSAHCTVNYLHGALHLFLGPKGETRKRILTNSTIIDDIAATIRRERQLPLFVAEGTTVQKIRRINSVPYLKFCYDKLQELSGSILIFGHSAADNDIHIYDAIFASRVKQVFFCVHNTKADWSKLREKLARFSERRPDIDIRYVDGTTARVWNGSQA